MVTGAQYPAAHVHIVAPIPVFEAVEGPHDAHDDDFGEALNVSLAHVLQL